MGGDDHCTISDQSCAAPACGDTDSVVASGIQASDQTDQFGRTTPIGLVKSLTPMPTFNQKKKKFPANSDGVDSYCCARNCISDFNPNLNSNSNSYAFDC